MIARALETEILRLHQTEHWPIGTIAAQLRIHHSTVRRVLAQAGVPVAQAVPHSSIVDPYRAFMVETLTKYPTLRASRLHTMVRERGYQSQNHPILLTTNKVFGEWNQVFPNAACVSTLIDRLVHRAEIVGLEGESYRLKEAKERTDRKAKTRNSTARKKS